MIADASNNKLISCLNGYFAGHNPKLVLQCITQKINGVIKHENVCRIIGNITSDKSLILRIMKEVIKMHSN